MAKTCSTCRWWRGSGLSVLEDTNAVDIHGSTLQQYRPIGYCEPDYHAGAAVWKGLVASNYSCPEHKDKPDAD